MSTRKIALAGLGVALFVSTLALAVFLSTGSGAEISYRELLDQARSGSIDRAVIVKDRVYAAIDGTQRFAVIPSTEYDLAHELVRTGIEVEIRRSR